MGFNPSKHLIVFLHLEKTAGTTFNHAIGQAIGSQTYSWFGEAQLNEAYADGTVERLHAVAGHFQYGLHRLVKRKCLYFTLVRDPIDRIESWYYYQKQAVQDPGHRAASELDINAWIDWMIAQRSNIVENFQSMRLLGFSLSLPSSSYAESAIIRHVEKNFFYIAPHTQVEEMASQIADMLGVKLGEVVPGKVSSNKPKASEISEENRLRLLQLNKVDDALHKWVCERQSGQNSLSRHLEVMI